MSLKLVSRSLILTLLALLVFSLAAPARAQTMPATTFTVNTVNMFADVNPGNGACVDQDGNCGLMAAMQEANAWPGADTISIPAGTYRLIGRLEPIEAVTISGAGKTLTIIDRALDQDVPMAFNIKADVVIQNLRITNLPQAVVISSGMEDLDVTLSGVMVDECGNVLAEQGPAITNASDTSTITISNNSTITSNFSDACGAITNYGSMTIMDSSVTANEARVSYGGAICSMGPASTLSILRSLVNANQTLDVDNGSGGALFLSEGATSIEQSQINGNTSAKTGGGIYADDGSLNIYLTDISLNTGNYGGGIYSAVDSLTIDQSLISENTASGNGAGAYLSQHAVITNSTMINNEAGVNGGGVYTTKNSLNNLGTFYITNSTIDGNAADENGGGMYLHNNSDVMLANVTLTANTADADLEDGIAARGGGFYNNNDTLPLRTKNSVIALNLDLRDSAFEPLANDCYGALFSDGYNLLGYGGGFCQISGDTAGMQVGSGGVSIDPKLGPLAMYTPTNWYRPVLRGPLVDNGNPQGCTDYADVLLTSDQLQENPRPYPGGSLAGYIPRCDLGSIESFYTKKSIHLPLIIR